MRTIEINYNPDEDMDVSFKNGIFEMSFKARVTITGIDEDENWKRLWDDTGYLNFKAILNEKFEHKIVKFNNVLIK